MLPVKDLADLATRSQLQFEDKGLTMSFPKPWPILAIVCFLGVTVSGIVDAQSPAVRRTTLLVDDIEKSIDFYRRIGMTVWYDKTTSERDEEGVIGADDLPLTADPKRGRMVIMKGNDENIGMIGLLAYEKPPLASARGNLFGIGVGDFILMLEVEDINFAYGRLQQIGTRFHSPPRLFEMEGPEGNIADSGRRMFAYDPDGHLVEVRQPD